MVMVIPRPPSESEILVQRRREFREWLAQHTRRFEEYREQNPRGVGDQSVPQHLVVVLEPDHPRYMEVGQWVANDWQESGGWHVKFADERWEALGGYDGSAAGGVASDKLALVFVPILTAYDGAFLEWVQPGVRSLILEALESRR